ncbi:MAG: RHH-type proline utilization regulon transcriptional repressor/proline dehydrogenase [Candidatus Aldehydirespiratoraceae bacterium]|jgi:RHH-type proline utilization regulon transcriptional repressor/proline dehydrogenase/delta 1-pyrroline-5-carboxylate dehydrogenase
MNQLEGIVTDPDGVGFVMQFVDRVVRPDDDRVAAQQLWAIVQERTLPQFLSSIDRVLLRAGARLARILPAIVVPLARRRMRSIVGHLVAPAEREKLAMHLRRNREAGFALNINLLGEAVLGEREAERRLDELLDLVDQPDIDYVSVKISAIASQLNYFAHEDSLRRVTERLRLLVETAADASTPTFINFDMEEYHDLDLTLRAFMSVLSEPHLLGVDAGIVLQAYLPDSFDALQQLVEWANDRHAMNGGEVKVRLVKGANLAMERVDAAIHGWAQAPYASKIEADANYKRCLEWLLTPSRMRGVRLGVASHNLFDVAWAHLLATDRGVSHRIQFEMLQGMAPAQALAVRQTTEIGPTASPMLLYTPAVAAADFDVSISYLFRRLEETASQDNFLRHLFNLEPGSSAFAAQEQIFRTSLAQRNDVESSPRRTQDRQAPPTSAYRIGTPFRNEPETDPTLAANQEWISRVMADIPASRRTADLTTIREVDEALLSAQDAQVSWGQLPLAERQAILHRVADQLAVRRGELITTMVHEANKTFVEADGEVAEAIDFARYYGDAAIALDALAARFTPLGVVAVVPPWNFPVAIPAGGVLSSLAAGNAVLLKPAPETPRCAEIVAEACWAAGVPQQVLRFMPVPENEVGRHLITSVNAVILTGGSETADLFRSWQPDLRMFAETSGKNALIITPNADIDLAVADLVLSAFGHSGQKCSAASLAILVGDVYDSPRFRRQIIDAVSSIDVGPSTAIQTTMGPLTGDVNDRLARGLSQLDDGESWVVKPQQYELAGKTLWSPGVRDGVTIGSWFHSTECFGPVLGLVHARDLDEAIAIQNSSAFGLTGGIHSLDPAEIDSWTERVEVGNGYVNRAITGAVVQRQPFGGWKRSSVGPGAKAGGPNYVAQLGSWSADPDVDDDYATEWATHFSATHDPTDLFCEANVFRYRPLTRVLIRVQKDADERSLYLAAKAAKIAGVLMIESHASRESEPDLADRLGEIGVERMRVVGEPIGERLRIAANAAAVDVADSPVIPVGRVEFLHYVREQAISTTLHRFGNLAG